MLCAATHGVLADAKMSQTPAPEGAAVPPSGPTPPVPASPVALPVPLSCDGIGPLSVSLTGPLLLLEEELVGAVLLLEELVGVELALEGLLGGVPPELLVALGVGVLELAPVPPDVGDEAPLSSVLTMPPGGPSSELECDEPHASSSAARYHEQDRRKLVLGRDREAIVAAIRSQGLLSRKNAIVRGFADQYPGGRIRLTAAVVVTSAWQPLEAAASYGCT